jgi:hypothetical protein
MAFAAAETVSVGAMQTGAGDMMSRSFLVMVTSCGGPCRYPPSSCANGHRVGMVTPVTPPPRIQAPATDRKYG